MTGDTVKIELEIPRSLYKAVTEKAKEAGFEDLNEFFKFILEQLLAGGETSENVFSPEEEELVKERLRALGYIE